MPGIITHNQFGQEALRLSIFKASTSDFTQSRAEQEAFLLGNQGPDPLFYCVGDPLLVAYRNIGTLLHSEKTPELIYALSTCAQSFPEKDQPLLKAYACGFVCHYLLDKNEHPFVYSQQYALCQAGEDGLTERDGSDVHALIESELDEMMLYTKTGQTVANISPDKEFIRCDRVSLHTISLFVTQVIKEVYGKTLRDDFFSRSVYSFRRIQRVFHSPHGVKRVLLGKVERLLRNHSFVQAMSHRAIPLKYSSFDNHDHQLWENPFAKTVSSASFMDLFNLALQQASEALVCFSKNDFSLEDARAIVQNQNFSGRLLEDGKPKGK